MTELTFQELRDAFNEIADPKFRWVTMKGLYQQLKKRKKNLRIKEFHIFLLNLWKDWPNHRIDLSRGSSVVPGVKRYGLMHDGGYYNYVSIIL